MRSRQAAPAWVCLRVLVAVAWVRSLIGIYFTYAIVRPSGWELEYVMTHSDAILGSGGDADCRRNVGGAPERCPIWSS